MSKKVIDYTTEGAVNAQSNEGEFSTPKNSRTAKKSQVDNVVNVRRIFNTNGRRSRPMSLDKFEMLTNYNGEEYDLYVINANDPLWKLYYTTLFVVKKVNKVNYVSRLVLRYTNNLHITIEDLVKKNQNREDLITPNASIINADFDETSKSFLQQNGVTNVEFYETINVVNEEYLENNYVLILEMMDVLGGEVDNYEITADVLDIEQKQSEFFIRTEKLGRERIDVCGNANYADHLLSVRVVDKNNGRNKGHILSLNGMDNNIQLSNIGVSIDFKGIKDYDERNREVIRMQPEVFITSTSGHNSSLTNFLFSLCTVAELASNQNFLNKLIYESMSERNDYGNFNILAKVELDPKTNQPVPLSMAKKNIKLENILEALEKLTTKDCAVYLDIEANSTASIEYQLFADNDKLSVEKYIREAFSKLTNCECTTRNIIRNVITLPKVLTNINGNEVDSRCIKVAEILGKNPALELLHLNTKVANNPADGYSAYVDLMMAIDPEASVVGDIYRVEINPEFLIELMSAFNTMGIGLIPEFSTDEFGYRNTGNRVMHEGLRRGSSTLVYNKNTNVRRIYTNDALRNNYNNRRY